MHPKYERYNYSIYTKITSIVKSNKKRFIKLFLFLKNSSEGNFLAKTNKKRIIKVPVMLKFRENS